MHGPRPSIEECKVLRVYYKKYAEQPALAAIKIGKTIKFDGTTEEVNTMVAHDAPIPRKEKGKNLKNSKSGKYTAVPSE